jgi:hypothetical protein
MSTGSAVPPTTAQRRSALEAFARALRREAHNLQQRPDLLWQQLSIASSGRTSWCPTCWRRTRCCRGQEG